MQVTDMLIAGTARQESQQRSRRAAADNINRRVQLLRMHMSLHIKFDQFAHHIVNQLLERKMLFGNLLAGIVHGG